jgi:Ni,Fe-hydrogenase III large subunit/Ni,Fe-hydrogenase III component G
MSSTVSYRRAPLNPHAVPREALKDQVSELLAAGGRLVTVTCHDDGEQLRVVYSFDGVEPGHIDELVVHVPLDDPWIPSLAAVSFPAGNFEREMRGLFGLRPVNHPQPHRLVRHGHWPRGWYPMRRDAIQNPTFNADTESFPFLEVEGPGVYEIAVGPIHAGIIEPGHFRFSVVGETIIRMEARQWYMHRGIEKLFQGREPGGGIELAEAVAGDSPVGHGLAYVMAVEDALQIAVPETDRLQRALLLELERLHNHITDLGALANDAGFGIVNAHASWVRETLLRINKEVTGHRFLRGALSVGGTVLRTLPDPKVLVDIADQVADIVTVTLDHSIVRDRFVGTARVSTGQAESVGALGLVARASGVNTDARLEHPFVDLGEEFHIVTETGGDVHARYLVRAREFAVSIAVVKDLIERLGVSRKSAPRHKATASRAGLGIVEGWRGTICHRVELDRDGNLSRVKIVDPSFFNWPALPIALSDTIVPDFPLVNKSFNLSYSGNDL